MKTEAKKVFECGFVLGESELRRIHDTLIQQIKRTSIGESFQTMYQLKYRNGSVGYLTNLDEVLEQENFGSTTILRLRMAVFDREEKPSNRISVEFSNTKEDKGYDSEPISYTVFGEDRDWVFVTGSQLDERIGKISKFSPTQFFDRKGRSWIFPILLMLLMFMGYYFSTRVHSAYSDGLRKIDVVERNLKAGMIADRDQVTIDVARIILTSNDPSVAEYIWLPFAMMIPILIFPALSYLYSYFHPPFNFLWGDYVTLHNRRKGIWRFLIGGVLLAIVLGIVINYLSKKIGL
ncbi:MAG: hypothetical protein ABR991_09720 [Terracidiphilus sp.]|jgi:hypothetical protein